MTPPPRSPFSDRMSNSETNGSWGFDLIWFKATLWILRLSQDFVQIRSSLLQPSSIATTPDRGNPRMQNDEVSVAPTPSKSFLKCLALSTWPVPRRVIEYISDQRNKLSMTPVESCASHRGKIKRSSHAELLDWAPKLVQKTLLFIQGLLFGAANIQFSLAIILIAALIGPASALDDRIPLQAYPVSTPTSPDLGPRMSICLVGTYIIAVAGLVATATKSLSGPLMGISSVLWLMMRNDAAVKPSISWAVFAIWSCMVLTYLSLQTRRVALGNLYILLTLAFAAVCLCIMGIVERSSLHDGLVTAIPPCTSFAAYAVAFCFPARRFPSPQETSV